MQRYNKKSKTQVIYAIIHKNNVKSIKNGLKKRVSRGVLSGGFFAENEMKIEVNCSKKAVKIAAKNGIKFHKKEEKQEEN